MISFQGVTKSFEGKHVLGPFTQSYELGQTHVILGISGSGKTTLIRMAMDLLSMDEGNIVITEERDVLLKNDKLRYGYVMQKGGLFPHMNIQDNMTLASRCFNLDPKKVQERMMELLALMHLEEDLLTKYPSQVSGGQKQRLALLRALMMDPPIVFLDEPFAALDPITKHSLERELKDIFQKLQKTVFLVTHDLRVANHLGDTITLLKDGSIEQYGTFQDLLHKPASDFVHTFVESFMDTPQ